MVHKIGHPYSGLTVFFGTQHRKEKAITPVLNSLGINCQSLEIDTDQFGTFSGEIERKGTILETLRKKTKEVFKRMPQARLALASEGSFGPHPVLGFISSDHEALLLVDRELKREFYVDEIFTETNVAERIVSSVKEIQDLLAPVKFPSHALIIHPLENKTVLFKGITNEEELSQAIQTSLKYSTSQKVKVSTDMRAHFNPTRMEMIGKVAQKLSSRLNSFCPNCNAIGFWPAKSIEGLSCEECGKPSRAIKEVLWSCEECHFEEVRPREDGKKSIDPGQCEWCNP